MRRSGWLVVAFALAGCGLVGTPTPVPTPQPTVVASAPASAPASGSPSPSPALAFSLELPAGRDPRPVDVVVEPAGDELVVTVTNTTDQRIDELVLRWSTDLAGVYFIAPFVPSEDRIRDGGPPLVQNWSKWVIGPGERGEPAGTTSLGYGPLMPDAILKMTLHVDRSGDGPLSFDLQVLAGNDLLALASGGPAALRVQVP
ncbi:MAG: hypothetical protein IT341_01450 [Chloroflexi bacterium]|nr:hypothetical protein [Chloroflexota bacterium]